MHVTLYCTYNCFVEKTEFSIKWLIPLSNLGRPFNSVQCENVNISKFKINRN